MRDPSNLSFRRPAHGARSGAGIVFGLAGALATVSLVGVVSINATRQAVALASYTQQTGLSCGRCHTNPAGGGALTSFGTAFAANGHKVPAGEKSKKKNAAGGVTTAPAPEAPASVAAPAIVLDFAQAQAWSLRHPYYSHFLYSPDDYNN